MQRDRARLDAEARALGHRLHAPLWRQLGKLKAQAEREKAGRTDIEDLVFDLLNVGGWKYEEQAPFERYKADFYLPAKWLIIECDGHWHDVNPEKDDRRDAYFLGQGISVLRLSYHYIVDHLTFRRFESMVLSYPQRPPTVVKY